jgi:phosphoribosylamine--glycine ligase
MKILAIDTWSNCLDWLMRCQEWGHECLWFDEKRKDGSIRMAGKGIVPKLLDFDQLRKKWIGWAELIYLPDNTKYLDLLEPYRKIGYPIFGPSSDAADLELDRDKGQAAFEKVGLNVIPGKGFNDFAVAAKFVEKNQTWTVCKPSGDANKVLSYVGADAASLIYMLTERWPRNEKYVHDAKEFGFILQEKKVGTEFAVGAYHGPHGFNEAYFENFEFKKFMDGDKGPTTGEQGTLVMAVKKSKLADIALKPFAKMLRELDYVGYFDVSGNIDDKAEFWPFECTMRDGWPIRHNIQSLTEGDPAQWMLDLLNGYDTHKVKFNTCSISVVVSIPDYPNSKLTRRDVQGIPVYNVGDREHIHLCGVMLEEGPKQMGDQVVHVPIYKSAEDYLYVATGTGENIGGARKSAYSAVRKVKVATNDEQLRWDIGRGRLIEQLPTIQKLGFAKQFKP